MPSDTVVSNTKKMENTHTLDRAAPESSLRDVEAMVLIEAFMSLHRVGLLTDTEYQCKRLRLAAQR